MKFCRRGSAPIAARQLQRNQGPGRGPLLIEADQALRTKRENSGAVCTDSYNKNVISTALGSAFTAPQSVRNETTETTNSTQSNAPSSNGLLI